MSDFKKYCDFILNIIKKHNLQDHIISIYAYGSIAQGNFERNYSDTDLWFVINCNTLDERINITKNLSNVFDNELKSYLDKLHLVNNNDNKKYQYHSNWYFTEKEFIKYLETYPTRVIYPFKMNVWKIVYGVNHLLQVDLPSRADCIKFLQYDYEVFSSDLQYYSFSENPRDMIKCFLRALKKAIWILKDVYLTCKDEVLEKGGTILDDSDVIIILKEIQDLKSNDYVLLGENYTLFYLKLNKIIELYGQKIYDYVIENNYELISYSEFCTTKTWGNFVWEFAELVNRYVNSCDNKEQLISLLTEDYIKFIKYINEVLFSGKPITKILYGRYDIPLKRSRILNPLYIDELIYKNVMSLDGYKFLVQNHREKVLDRSLENLDLLQLSEYMENKYLPAVYDVFTYLFDNKEL